MKTNSFLDRCERYKLNQFLQYAVYNNHINFNGPRSDQLK
jgi:hypothetical protein